MIFGFLGVIQGGGVGKTGGGGLFGKKKAGFFSHIPPTPCPTNAVSNKHFRLDRMF